MALAARLYLPAILTCFTVFLHLPLPSSGSSQPTFKYPYQIEQILRLSEVQSAIISSSNTSPGCSEAVIRVLNSTQLRKMYLDAFGKPQSGLLIGNVGWLGSYSECTKFIPDAHYCMTFVTVQNASKALRSVLPIRWGVCAPHECTEEDVTKVLQAIFAVLRNKTMLPVELSQQLVSPYSGDTTSKSVFCAKPSEYSTGVILTLTLCGLILFLCFVGTTLDIITNFIRSHPGSVNKTEGFMPVKTDSIATDSDRFPYFASDDSINPNFHGPPYPEGKFGTAPLLPGLDSPAKPNVVVQFFLCFSLIQNTNRILDTKVPPGAITSINGMRVLSMWWVILGHTYSIQLMTSISNLALIKSLFQRFTFLTVDNASFSVDSFFFLSGLLVSYLAHRQMKGNEGRLPLFKFYFHRFWRLTPAYMFVLLFFDKLTGFLGEGPTWYGLQQNPACDKYWWTNLLYINNFYPTTFMAECMPWAWYLANDMQFYIISPIILYAAYRFGIRGLLATVGVLLSATFITTAVILYHYNLDVSMFANQQNDPTKADFQSLVYIKPYCRLAPYLVGMLLGYVFHMKIRKIPKVFIFNVVGWCVAIVLALSTLYGEYKSTRKDHPKDFNLAENITYGTFSRCAWSLALAWVIYACHRGLGGLVNNILSARFWIPLSRLTYCAYLVHPIAIIMYLGSFETVRAYSDMHVSFEFLALVTASYLAAFVVAVCLEYPMMQLEKLIFKTNR